MSVLTVTNLSVAAASTSLVRDVSFSIDKGEIMALVGESGSGKTLTALSVMGLLPAGLESQGQITLNHGDGVQPSIRRGKDAGMIFQEPMTSLNPLHTLGRQVAEAVEIYQPQLSRQQLIFRVKELLGLVGLEHFCDRLGAYPHQLSGGERQRVMIAMAIANNPALLIADEPTTALDVTIQAQILGLLTQLCQRLGMAVLLITHDLSIVRKVAAKVAIMSGGEVVEQGKTATIFAAPVHVYTKKLLAAEPGGEQGPLPSDVPVLLECKEINVSFSTHKKLLGWKAPEKQILHEVSVWVPQGGTLGIVGESGSGKSTLALALLRLIRSEGRITFAGEALDMLKGEVLRRKRRDIQIVFQDPFASLNPRMTVGDIIGEGLKVHESRLGEEEVGLRVDAILQEVGLSPDAKERYPHQFSGGQRQRICIARALILRPRLIILDEPTSALDVSVQAQILSLLRELQDRHGLSYIFISHDLRVIRAMSHRVAVLRAGKVVETADVHTLFTHPQHEYTRALLASALAA